MFMFFLSSGLFQGWSLGANNMSNIFGTAVGSRMISFRKAALICSLAVILGAVISGAGVTDTLVKLGAVNALAGAFTVAFASAVTIFLMTKAGIPVSTSQSIIGAIVGWNLFSGFLTDPASLTKIITTWLICPVLSALFSMAAYLLIVRIIRHYQIHMFKLDSLVRYGLILVGAFGAYSMGANNISTVMGVFIPVVPFPPISFFGFFTLTAAQQLFLLGGIAIAVGVFTYSKRVILTVGKGIMDLSPVAAFVAVLSHSLVLFLFASKSLEQLLLSHGLPAIPLVPVSSSQAIVGAVIGIGLLKGGRSIQWKTVGSIFIGWIATPLLAGIICFVSLFMMQNLFQQKAYEPVTYVLSSRALQRIDSMGVPTESLGDLVGKEFESARAFRSALAARISPSKELEALFLDVCLYHKMEISKIKITAMNRYKVTEEQRQALEKMAGRIFAHTWALDNLLAESTPAWKVSENNAAHNKQLAAALLYIHDYFKADRRLPETNQ
ncbi:MAG: anion permease [Deltaproteobacteria bacterium]|nr:anion permease [Deltaproteobacteria bacterium]